MLLLAGILLLTAAVRLPGISRPLVGPFATKNAIYAMSARNWASGRAPIWLPTVDCLAAGQRGLHLLELPLAAYVAGAGWGICGGSLDVWGRAVSIAFSVGAVALLYASVRRWHGDRPASAAALVLTLSPVSMFCGQSFMLESSAIFFMLLAQWSLDTWLATARWCWWSLTVLSVALLLCTKIYLAVMLVPLIWSVAYKIVAFPRPECARWVAAFLALLILGVAPATSWCLLVADIARADHPLAEHVYYSLARSTAVHSIPSPLLWHGEFYLRFLKGLVGTGLTPVGAVLALVGVFHAGARRHFVWLAGLGLLVAFLPGKFLELRYYLLLLVPACAVLAGLGYERLTARLRAPRLCSAILLGCGAICALWLAGRPTLAIVPEDRAVTTAATALRAISSPNEPVATLHGAAPDLLYYCDRPGWALSVNDPSLSETLEHCRRRGARWLVVADLASLAGKPAAVSVGRLPVAHRGNDYLICHLP